MAGITPSEGESAIAEIVYNGRNLELGLYTGPSSISESTTLANVTEVTGTSYGRKTLTAGSWTVDADGGATYPQQSFTPSGESWTGVRGYFIVDPATNKLLHIEQDDGNNQPFDIVDGQDYNVDLSNTVA